VSAAELIEDCPEADHAAAPVPSTLWIELTSKCPFSCVFCSRRIRRGAGEHMDFSLLESLLADLENPECIRLNYSGESMHYPRLPEAIRLAKQTGASVELVSSLASANEELLGEIVRSGLDRLGISLHTVSPERWTHIYGSGSLDRLLSRLERLVALRDEAGSGLPELEVAFVATQSNLEELPSVVSLARRKGIRLVTVLPVINRDLPRGSFPAELDDSGHLRSAFREALRETVRRTRAAFPGVEIRGGPEQDGPGATGLPVIPPGTRVRTCDQDPWSTAHVLSNGDVVPCEVQDTLVLGSLRDGNLRSIWQGSAYRSFRRDFMSGRNPACGNCSWKVPMQMEPPLRVLSATDWRCGQFLRGWYPRDAAGTVWSRREGVLVLPSGRNLLLSGALPPADTAMPNSLEIVVDGRPAGKVTNPTPGLMNFSTCVEIAPGGGGNIVATFRTTRPFHPLRAGVSGDARELGFAFFGIEVRP
jgi:radical SAM protein with 4Fe4S-binding SPASM domain